MYWIQFVSNFKLKDVRTLKFFSRIEGWIFWCYTMVETACFIHIRKQYYCPSFRSYLWGPMFRYVSYNRWVQALFFILLLCFSISKYHLWHKKFEVQNDNKPSFICFCLCFSTQKYLYYIYIPSLITNGPRPGFHILFCRCFSKRIIFYFWVNFMSALPGRMVVLAGGVLFV